MPKRPGRRLTADDCYQLEVNSKVTYMSRRQLGEKRPFSSPSGISFAKFGSRSADGRLPGSPVAYFLDIALINIVQK